MGVSCEAVFQQGEKVGFLGYLKVEEQIPSSQKTFSCLWLLQSGQFWVAEVLLHMVDDHSEKNEETTVI